MEEHHTFGHIVSFDEWNYATPSVMSLASPIHIGEVVRGGLMPPLTKHREQIKSMLSALGVTPPSIDGWDYGEFTKTLVPIEKENKG